MDLRKNQITLGELLDNPRSLAVLQRRFGKWMNHPKLGQNRGITLEQLIQKTRFFVSSRVIEDTLAELQRL